MEYEKQTKYVKVVRVSSKTYNLIKNLMECVLMKKKIKVMPVFGTRPEVIKMAPLVLELQKCSDEFDTIVTARATLILTDSGGVQEEAPSLGVPVLVLRDTTERPEGVKSGTLKLTGTDEDTIYNEANLLLSDQHAYDKMAKASNPYGDGLASQLICDAIQSYFDPSKQKPASFEVK